MRGSLSPGSTHSPGRGSVKRVDIGNPPGFTAPRAATLAEISVWVDPATVRAPVVVIHELIVDTPLITYERSDRGTNRCSQRRRCDFQLTSYSEPGMTPSSRPPPFIVASTEQLS